MDYPKFRVCCRCFTFNHSQYITDTMNGFTMQQTSFPFVCCIVDDASTDGEQDVIRKYVEENFDFTEGSVAYHKETDYAHITYAQHKTNKNCYFAVLYLKENHYSQRKPKFPYLEEWRNICEYEAICEGDDYWIDYQKLQKQYEFLEENNNYVLVHTAFDSFNQENSKLISNNRCWPSGNVLKNLVTGNYNIGTLTTFYRKSSYERIPRLFIDKKFLMGDLPLWIELSSVGMVKYLSDKTSVYRILPNSASHNSDLSKEVSFIKSAYEIRAFYAAEYGYHNIDWNYLINRSLLKLAYYRNSILLAEKSIHNLNKSNKRIGFKCYLLYYSVRWSFFKKIVGLIYKTKR